MCEALLLLLSMGSSLQDGVESLRRGDQALEAKEYGHAIQEYTAFLESSPRGLLTTLAALTNRAAAKNSTRDFDGAIEDCSRAMKLAPRYVAAYLNRGWARREKGDLEGAFEDYSKAIELSPKHGPAYAGRADTRIQKNDLDGAVQDCEAALAIDPRSVDALISKARIKGVRYEWDEGIAAATRALEIDPKNAAAHVYRGTLLMGKGDPKAAMDNYNQALQTDPKHVYGWLARGALKRQEGDLEGALSDLSRGLELDPKDVMGLIERALVHLTLGSPDKAVADAQKAFKAAPAGSPLSGVAKSHVTRMLMGRGLDRKGKSNQEGAAEDFRAVLELDPGVALAHQNLGDYYLGEGRFKDSLASLTRALELDPTDWLSHFLRAWTRCSLGDYEKGLADVDRAFELGGEKVESPEGHRVRGACLLGLRRWADSLEGYRRALKIAQADWDKRERAEALIALLPDLVRENPTGPVPQVLLAKGKASIEAATTTRGIAIVEEALALDATLVEGHEVLAIAYDSLRGKGPAMGRRAILEAFEVEGARKGLSPALRRIVRKRSSLVLAGLLWIMDHQMPDGRWSGDGFADVCPAKENRCEGKSEPGHDLRATSFVLLACFGAGFSHLSKENFDTKSMGDRIKAALQWIIALQDKDGKLGSSVEEHALATLVLSEAYGMTASAPLKEPAQKAVAHLMALKRSEGGWPGKAKTAAIDVQATGWALIALASARASELSFEAAAIEEAMAALRNSGPTELISVAASRLLKRKDEEDLREFSRKIPLPRKDPPAERDALRCLLGTIAARLDGDDAHWEQWKGGMKEGVIPTFVAADACRDGSWEPVGVADAPRGRLITTALTLVDLEVYYGYATTLCALANPVKK